jgi:hypothetical protein
MGTTIKITPPGGAEQTILAYSKCSVTLSATNRTGSFSLALPDSTGVLVDAYPVGSDVYIKQNDHIFRGWVLNPAKSVNGKIKYISIDGLCYTGRTQKIVVTENYTSQKISDIVIDLFTKYMPTMNQDSIVACDKVISIKFKEEFLFDCMERLCKLAGYEWVIYEPLPEEIDPAPENSGWTELFELVPPALATDESLGWSEEIQHRIYYPPRPSDTLYPADDLYPG